MSLLYYNIVMSKIERIFENLTEAESVDDFNRIHKSAIAFIKEQPNIHNQEVLKRGDEVTYVYALAVKRYLESPDYQEKMDSLFSGISERAKVHNIFGNAMIRAFTGLSIELKKSHPVQAKFLHSKAQEILGFSVRGEELRVETGLDLGSP